MKIPNLRSLISNGLGTWVCGMVLFVPLQLHADEIAVQIVVSASFEPTNATGLVIDKGGVKEVKVVKVTKKDAHDLIVNFGIDQKDISPETFASAVVVSENGEVVFGHVKQISESHPDLDLARTIPICPPQRANDPLVQSQSGTLQQLVNVRMEQRKVVRNKITSVMNQDLMLKLQGLERLFGLSYDKNLSPDMEALELSNRLSRLAVAIENVDYHKQFTDTPPAEASAARK